MLWPVRRASSSACSTRGQSSACTVGASWVQSHAEALAARWDRAAVASASRAARRVLAAARASQSIAAATSTNSASEGSWARSDMANDQPGGMTKNQAASIESTVADTVGPTPKNQAEARIGR